MKLQYIKYITTLLWVALAVQSWGQVSFLPAQMYSLGSSSQPEDISIGDFNNDGKPDILVGAVDKLYILTNSGNGSLSEYFSTPVGAVNYVDNADFNNDGKLDILYNYNINYTSIITNTGTSFNQYFFRNQSSGLVKAADFNSDGKMDYSYYDGSNIVVMTNSGSSFGVASSFFIQSNSNNYLHLDINNDSKIDIVSIAYNSNNLIIFTGSGIGTFSLYSSNNTGYLSNYLAVEDLNNDSYKDIVLVNSGNPGNIQILTNTGIGTFNLARQIFINEPREVKIEDFNGDGKKDLVVALLTSTQNIQILFNDNQLNFSSTQVLNVDQFPESIQLIDINLDGRIDIVAGSQYTNGKISLLVNNTLSPNQPVRLESGFGTNGIALLTNTILGGTFNIYDADIFPNGKMIMIGFYNAAGIGRSNDIALVQVNANGTLDNTFDGDGIKTFGFEDIAGGEWNDVSPSVEIDKLTGKIYFSLLSIATSNGNRTTYVYRLNSSGAFDNSFNSMGYAYVQDMTGADRGYTQFQSLTLDENRKPIISFGIQIDPNLLDSYNVKMLTDGSGRDNTFGSGGQTRFWTTGIWGQQGWDHCYNIKINPANNKIYNYGYFHDNNGGSYFPGRFYITENNSLPAYLGHDCGNNCFETINDVDFDVDKLITVGNLNGDDRYGGPTINTGSIGVVKYNSNLTQDNTFDGDGFKEYYIRGIDRGYGVHKAQDGNYIVGGMSKANAGDGWDFSLSKLKPNGDFDESFNGTGKMWIDLGGDDYCRKTMYQRPYVYMFGSKDGIPSIAKVRVENVGFTGSTSICQGQSTTLTATGGNTYTWQPGNLSGAVQTLSPSVTTTYTVTGCIGTLCGASMVTVSVTAYPNLTITTNPSPLPNFAGMPFTVSGTGASTYDWRYNGTTFSGQSFSTNFSGARNITLIGTNLAGCTTTLSAILATTSSLNFGLIASYPFSGNALDVSGNNYHGSTFGGVSLTTDRFGQTNKAMNFDGTDGYIDIANTENLHLQTEHTLAVWVKSNDSDGFLVGKHFAGEVAGFFNHIGGYSGVENKYNYYISGNWLNLPTIVNDNNWHFLAASYSNGTLKAYVDGAIVGTINYNYTTTNSRTIKIGGGPTLNYLNGLLDDIRVYNRELILSEIQALYNEGSQTILGFNPIPSQSANVNSYTIAGVSGGASGNTITFTSSNLSVATISGNVVSILRAGVTTITATQAGNASYLDATPVSQVLNVTCPASNLLPTNTPIYNLGNVVNLPFTFSGISAGAVNWTVSGGMNIPPGLSFNTITGVLEGTVAGQNFASYTIFAQRKGCFANGMYNTTVLCGFNILPSNLTTLTGTLGSAYSLTFSVSGTNGIQPQSWSVASGSLPIGITLNSITGIINGTPTTTITSTFGIRASYQGGGCFSQNNYTFVATVPSIPVTSATLSGSNTIFTLGGSIALTSAYSPSNANTNTLVGWNTTLNGIASFNTVTGLLTALQNGDGVVAIQSRYTTITSNIVLVTITNNKINQTITGLPTSIVSIVGFTANLPSTATSGLALSYTSTNNNIASVSGSVLSFYSAGVATITASNQGNLTFNGISQSFVVTVLSNIFPVVSANIFGSNTISIAGGTTQLTSVYLPSNANSNTVLGWSVSNTSIATISSTGLLQALNNGVVTITGSYGTVTGFQIVTISGQCLPTLLVSQPISQTVCGGTFAALSASALGTNLLYAWSNGATTSSLITSVAGSYQVTVSGQCGTVISNSATISTLLGTSIVSNTSSETLCGNSKTLSVAGLGVGLTYRWSNGNTNASFVASNSGNYTVTVLGQCGNAVSNPISVLLQPTTQITTQPQNASFISGNFATVSVSALGSNLSYLWSNGETTSVINTSLSGVYQVTVSGSCGVAVSNQATVTEQFINLPQTILGLSPISNKTYGDSPINLGNITATSGLPVSVSVVSNPPNNVVSFLNNQINILGGGTVTVTAVQLGSPPTYLPASSVSQIFSIAKVPLTVSSINASRVYNASNPLFLVNFFGFINGDGTSNLDNAPTVSTTATQTSDVGTYPINIAGGNDNAYDYQYIGATLRITRATNAFTILPKAITLSVGDTITIGAEAESKLPLNLTLDNSTIATLISNKIIGKNAGTGLVSANQSQSLNYDSLATKTIPVTVNAAPSRDFGIIGSNKVPVGIIVIYSQPSVPGYTYSWTIIGSGFQIVPGTENTPNLQVIFSENATPAEVNSVVKDQDQNVVSNTRLEVNPLGSDEAKLVRDLQKVDCPPEVTDCKNAYITDVAFGKLKNLGTGCSRAGFGDFTVGLTLDSLLMGDSYDLSLGSVAEAGKSSFFAVWIDYNNNGKFTDQDDFLAASFENASKFEIKNIIIKNQTEYEGPRRMRVSMRADAVISPTDPCAKTGGSGETEDYLVFIRKPDELQACSFISPNKDGKNDNFIIRGINPKESNKLIVMDRYGSLVYEKENYANDWDGKNSKNNELTEGTYYYQFINGENEIKGFVEVKRK